MVEQLNTIYCRATLCLNGMALHVHARQPVTLYMVQQGKADLDMTYTGIALVMHLVGTGQERIS